MLHYTYTQSPYITKAICLAVGIDLGMPPLMKCMAITELPLFLMAGGDNALVTAAIIRQVPSKLKKL